VKFKVTIPDVNALEGALAEFGPQASRAAALAVSTTTRATGTAGRREASARSGISQKRLARRFYVRSNGLDGVVWIGLDPLPAGYAEPLTPRRPNPTQQRALAGASAKGGAFKFPHAFVARMPSGHVGIFRRVGKKRLPINEERLTAEQLGLSGLGEYLQAFASAKLYSELDRQLGRLWE